MIYDPGMIRSLTLLIAAAVLPVAGTAAVAGAEPAPPTCTYDLSPPQVVAVSGTDMVTATLSTGACDHSTTLPVGGLPPAGGQPRASPMRAEQRDVDRAGVLRAVSAGRDVRLHRPGMCQHGESTTVGLHAGRSRHRDVLESVPVEPHPVDNRVLRGRSLGDAMKKILVLCATVCLAAAVAACGSESSYTTTESDTGTATATSKAASHRSHQRPVGGHQPRSRSHRRPRRSPPGRPSPSRI